MHRLTNDYVARLVSVGSNKDVAKHISEGGEERELFFAKVFYSNSCFCAHIYFFLRMFSIQLVILHLLIRSKLLLLLSFLFVSIPCLQQMKEDVDLLTLFFNEYSEMIPKRVIEEEIGKITVVHNLLENGDGLFGLYLPTLYAGHKEEAYGILSSILDLRKDIPRASRKQILQNFAKTIETHEKATAKSGSKKVCCWILLFVSLFL